MDRDFRNLLMIAQSVDNSMQRHEKLVKLMRVLYAGRKSVKIWAKRESGMKAIFPLLRDDDEGAMRMEEFTSELLYDSKIN